MAADACLLEQSQVPTLRLYAWEGPWLSLGYSQSVDWLRPLPWDRLPVGRVRRPSGGRAVLHHQEITYAVVLPTAEGSVTQVYRMITGWWLDCLAALGYSVGQLEGSARSQGHPSCYQSGQAGEVAVAGRKFVGSAQLRRGSRVLQHGSLPLAVDEELFRVFFGEARLPACLPGLNQEALVSHFPQPLMADSWSVEELESIAANCEEYQCPL